MVHRDLFTGVYAVILSILMLTGIYDPYANHIKCNDLTSPFLSLFCCSAIGIRLFRGRRAKW